MSISAEDDMIAAEYSLGTLDPGERAAIAARRLREPDLDRAIEAWSAILAPLAETIPPMAPPRDYLADIEARLDAGPSRVPADGEVVELRRRLSRWRAGALAAASIAAALVIGIGLRESMRLGAPHEFVAVLQKDADAPAFLVTVNLDSRSLIVRPVAAAAPAGKSYELWIIDKAIGPPKSLGVIDAKAVTDGPTLSYDPAIVQNATYAVTVEPQGGSPDGKPSGAPVFVGKLIPTGR